MLQSTIFIIICTICFSAMCRDGELRLVGGADSLDGYVELCVNGRFGKVCNDEWGHKETKVLCRQLGVPFEGSVCRLLLKILSR